MSGDQHGGEEIDDLLSMADAGKICGLSPHTLAQQAEKGRLHARKIGHAWITTRQALDDYLAAHARRRATE